MARGLPPRYQGIRNTKLTRLVEYLGGPEQPPTFRLNAAYSRDGKFFISTTPGIADPDSGHFGDSQLTLWDTSSGQFLKEIVVPEAVVTALDIMPDGKTILAGLVRMETKGKPTYQAVVFDLNQGKKIHGIDVGPGLVSSVAISPSGRRGLISTIKGKLISLDFESGKASTLYENKNQRIIALAFDKTGRKAIASAEDELHLFDLEKAKAIKTFKAQKEQMISVALSPGAKFAAAFTLDDQVKLWDAESGKLLGVLKRGPFNQSEASLAFVGEDKLAITWSANDALTGMQDLSFVTVWDGNKEIWNQKIPLKGIVPLVVQGDRLLAGGGANPFYLFNLADGALAKTWGGHKGAVVALARDAKGRLLSAGQDGTFLLWEKGQSRPLLAIKDSLQAQAVPAPGLPFALTGPNHALRLLDVDGDKVGKQFSGHTGQVVSLDVHGNLLASASHDRTVKLWRLDSGKEKNTLTGHGDAVNAVAFSPKGDWLASASDDNTIRIWDLEAIGDKKVPAEDDSMVLEGHDRQVACLLWPMRDQLFSAGQDMTIKQWDPKKGKVVRTFAGHKNWINSMIVVGNYLISASDDLTVRLWDLGSGKEVDRIDLGPSSDGPRSLLRGEAANTFLVGTAGWAILRFEISAGKK